MCLAVTRPSHPLTEAVTWHLRFRLYITAGDFLAWLFEESLQRGLRLQVLYWLATRSYDAARGVCAEE